MTDALGRRLHQAVHTGHSVGAQSDATVPPAILDRLLGASLSSQSTQDAQNSSIETKRDPTPTAQKKVTSSAGDGPQEPPATRHHDPRCAGCRDYALLLGREAAARTDFYQAGLVQSDALTDLRMRLVGYLKARHPLRTEQLKQRGTPVGPHTDNYTLLAALSQWDTMHDQEIRSAVAGATDQELRSLRDRNTELDERLAQHAEQRHRDEETYLEHIHGLQDQVDKLTSALSEASNDRRELSRGAARLADHITAQGGALPTLLRKHDWYRRWSDTTQPKSKPHRPQPTGAAGRNPAGSRQTALPLPSDDDSPAKPTADSSAPTPTDSARAAPPRHTPHSGKTSSAASADPDTNSGAHPADPEPADATAPSSPSQWPDLIKRYQPTWGELLLQHLWNGSVWTRGQALQDGPTASLQVLLERLIEHGLVDLRDAEQAQVLAINDDLATFAVDVGARLGPRKPSPAVRALDSMAGLPEATTTTVLRVMAVAARDHQLLAVHRKQGHLPLIQVRPRGGPQLPARWLLPWLPDHATLLQDLLARARGRDKQAGLIVAVHRHNDGADDTEWGPLVAAHGYDAAEVKRLWLDSPHR